MIWPHLRGSGPPGGPEQGAQARHFADVRFLARTGSGLLLITTCGSVRTGPATGRSSSQAGTYPYGFVSHCEARTLGFQRFGPEAQIRGSGSPEPSNQPVFARPPSRAHQVVRPFEGLPTLTVSLCGVPRPTKRSLPSGRSEAQAQGLGFTRSQNSGARAFRNSALFRVRWTITRFLQDLEALEKRLFAGAPAPLSQCPEQSDRIVLATFAGFWPPGGQNEAPRPRSSRTFGSSPAQKGARSSSRPIPRSVPDRV